jgi:hypothetical protein
VFSRSALFSLSSLLVASLASFTACQLLNDPPPATPTTQPAPSSSEGVPLPLEEAPPAESAAPPVAEPEAKPVEPGVATNGAPTRGKLPKAVIDEKLKSVGPAIQACYEQGLKTKPALRGSVDINFVVAPDGKVAHADTSDDADALDDTATVDCILSAIKKLEFPAPSGGRVFINYPLKLEPPKPGSP